MQGDRSRLIWKKNYKIFYFVSGVFSDSLRHLTSIVKQHLWVTNPRLLVCYYLLYLVVTGHCNPIKTYGAAQLHPP